VTGLVDAVSFLSLGHVFHREHDRQRVSSGRTGVDAGLSVARSGAALAAFATGALVAGRMVARAETRPRLGWASTAFGVEALLLLCAAAVAAGGSEDLLRDPGRLYGLIVLTAVAMGIRNAVVRKLAQHDLTTTVLTQTITGPLPIHRWRRARIQGGPGAHRPSR